MAEQLRLRNGLTRRRSELTSEQVREAVGRMPKVARQRELNEIAQPHFDRVDDLVKKMWAIPACTAEGKRAKMEVLLFCVAGLGWRDSDRDADYDVGMTRSLLLEFLGGEQAERFKEEFAA